MVASAIAAVIGLALGAVAAAGPRFREQHLVLPSSSCGPVFYKGSGSPQLLIATDLPLQGAGRAQTPGDAAGGAVRAREAVQLQGREVHGRLPGLRRLDRADRCVGSGEVLVERARVRGRAELVGVLGTFNSGCAKLIVPILNRAPGGAVAMLSSANTNVGLTHNAPWNSPGEPRIYYPTGVRNYARVAASDDYQGPARCQTT